MVVMTVAVIVMTNVIIVGSAAAKVALAVFLNSAGAPHFSEVVVLAGSGRGCRLLQLRGPLMDACVDDPLQASGATTRSSLRYVAEKRPSVCIMENVTAMADRFKDEDGTVTRDVDMVLDRLRAFSDFDAAYGYPAFEKYV